MVPLLPFPPLPVFSFGSPFVFFPLFFFALSPTTEPVAQTGAVSGVGRDDSFQRLSPFLTCPWMYFRKQKLTTHALLLCVPNLCQTLWRKVSVNASDFPPIPPTIGICVTISKCWTVCPGVVFLVAKTREILARPDAESDKPCVLASSSTKTRHKMAQDGHTGGVRSSKVISVLSGINTSSCVSCVAV